MERSRKERIKRRGKERVKRDWTGMEGLMEEMEGLRGRGKERVKVEGEG